MTTTTRRRARHTIALTMSTLLAALLIAGCSGADSAGESSGTADIAPGRIDDRDRDATDGSEDTGEEAPDSAAENPATRTDEADQDLAGSRQALTAVELTKNRVVSTGTVSLSSTNPGGSVRETRQIVDEHSGQVAQEQTETTPEGEIEWARLVVRVPVDEFDQALTDLKQVGQLGSSTSESADVTEQYVDLQSRVRAQERSLERVELLYSRAESIRDIVAIEAQVANRQEELDSLKGRLRVLNDQTALSTITVHISHSRDAKPVDRDTAGFVAGLSAGWDQLTAMFVGTATGIGAALPFLLLVLPFALAFWLAIRLLTARRSRKAAARA